MKRLSFLKDLGIVTVSHGIAGSLALLYTVIVSRFLGVADYGFFQAIMAIYSVLTVFVGPFNMAAMHSVAVAEDASKPLVTGRFVRFALLVGGACTGGLVCLSPWLAVMLHGSVLPIIWMAMLVTITAVLTVFYGTLQAYNDYILYGVNKVVETLVMLLTGAVLVVAGASVSGAMLGYVLGLASVLLGFFVRRKRYRFQHGKLGIWSELGTFVNILLVYGAIYLVSDVPQIIARSRMDAEASGLYGALYNLRNVVLPFCFALAAPLYSRAVSGAEGQSAYLQALVPILGLGGAFLGVGLFVPQLPFRIIYGAAFVEAARYMALYGIVLALQMIATVTMFYQIARKRLVRVHLLVPIVSIAIGTVLPNLTIPRLILTQIAAWALYLSSFAVVNMSRCGNKSVSLSRLREKVLPGHKGRCL
jgi:O-antigen/teichoic acid export membrane protein